MIEGEGETKGEEGERERRTVKTARTEAEDSRPDLMGQYRTVQNHTCPGE